MRHLLYYTRDKPSCRYIIHSILNWDHEIQAYQSINMSRSHLCRQGSRAVTFYYLENKKFVSLKIQIPYTVVTFLKKVNVSQVAKGY